MLNIYHSNQIEVLKDLLIEIIKRNPLNNPLTKENILVQSPGIAQWLKIEFAEQYGICAAVDFPLPASFLWKLFSEMLPNIPSVSTFNKETITWLMMSSLPELIEKNEFKIIKQYLYDDNANARLYQLCEKIADTFDQYLMYRPDWIHAWENGDSLPNITQKHPWQPILWEFLVKKVKSLGKNHWHRANMHYALLSNLKNINFFEKTKIKRIFIFGISSMPPSMIEAFDAISQMIEVHLLLCNPCKYYWSDEKSPKFLNKLAAQNIKNKRTIANPSKIINQTLLGSMGKLGRDYLHQIHDLQAYEIDAFVEITPHTTLQKIQHNILELDHSDIINDPLDRSLIINSCHSPIRELEVLHDHLLELFNKDTSLQPKDVIIMLPDINKYAPFIHAVFGEKKKDQKHFIPYSISDLKLQNEHPILDALLFLLSLNSKRCTASEILELIETPSIRLKFNIQEKSLPIIKKWITDAAIYWGIDSRHQSIFDLPDMNLYSWDNGIKRLLMGYFLPESSGTFNGIYPLNAGQNSQAILLGSFALLIDEIKNLMIMIKEDRSIEDWIKTIQVIMERFFFNDEVDEWVFHKVQQTMTKLLQNSELAEYNESVDLSIILTYLKNQFQQQKSNQKFLAGQVNFCTLMPMRAIPFQVIALLGMNDGIYPRTIPESSFDLITQNPRKGDRSRCEDDRYLFLEAILSARKTLYISFIGKNQQDNTELYPSILVHELLGLVKPSNTHVKEKLFKEQTLQPFNTRNFDKKDSVFSYSKEWLSIHNNDHDKLYPFNKFPLSNVYPTSDNILLDQLIKFFHNPCKFFLNQQLNVYFNQQTDELENHEPFCIEALRKYQLKIFLLNHLLNNQSEEYIFDMLIASGKLPYKSFGKLIFNENINEVKPLVSNITKLTTGKTRDNQSFRIALSTLSIKGHIKPYYNKQQISVIQFRPTSIKPKDIISIWLEHLCCTLTNNKDCVSYLLGSSEVMEFSRIEKIKAQNYLDHFITFYLKGLDKPLPLFIESAWESIKAEDIEQQKTKAMQIFSQPYFNSNKKPEGLDPYIQRCFQDLDSNYEEFSQIREILLQPIIDHMTYTKS